MSSTSFGRPGVPDRPGVRSYSPERNWTVPERAGTDVWGPGVPSEG